MHIFGAAALLFDVGVGFEQTRQFSLIVANWILGEATVLTAKLYLN